MTQLLTQIILHPVFWHLIESMSSDCTLTPHRHRDKSLISLHLRLRPARVGSESKNKGSELAGSGSDRSVMRFVGGVSPACVSSVSESSGTWGKIELDGSLAGAAAVIGIASALAMGAKRTRRSESKHISASYIPHHVPSSVPLNLRHYLSRSRLA